MTKGNLVGPSTLHLCWLSDIDEICVLAVAGVFHDTFHSLSHVTPQVLYPVPDCFSTLQQSEQHSFVPADVHSLFLSINRYERKKNIALALDALGSSFTDVHSYSRLMSVCQYFCMMLPIIILQTLV